MKTEKQIRERIDFLESRGKDGIDVKREMDILESIIWLWDEENVIRDFKETVAEFRKENIQYLRTVLWALED